MSRLSREKKREQQQAAHAANLAAAPIDVRVPVGGADTRGASVGGVTVIAGPGEEIQQAVLDRLHRIAVASGHAVLATVHDERLGCVVPLRVDPDGSSHFTARPVPMGTVPAGTARESTGPDRPTHLLRSVPEPAPPRDSAGDSTPTFALRPVPGPEAPRDAAPAFPPRAVPEPAEVVPPGTVAPPTGTFGPPPPMDAGPRPDRLRAHGAAPVPEPLPDPDPGPAPPRGFDAVAEAVLGDGPPAGENHLAVPMARISGAVREGRIDTADRLAEETVAEASGTLGPEHPEVLRLRELAAYIAYLGGEPLRAFRISLDLAAICRRAGDAEAAYGNVRSAATAWRAVRDPLLGLELGHELIALWTGLTAEDGPAADEIEELESARARMGRLTERARARRS
ncbi:tetratricopeptide repeat protein [Streptomyces sp. NPDC126497]|uniref:tetratricopeptide repeat protein n=1 Tax=Streptomyces sp. NPDC126497 TaxID=3155313 RepID=UPI003320C821